MIILLYGEDTFRSQQKLKEIINGYQAKHKSGLNLVYFKENNLEFDKVKEAIEAVSMFDEKKLIVLKDSLKNKSFQEDFKKYGRKNKLKDNREIIIVFHQEGKLSIPSIKRYLTMSEEFKHLEGADLVNWVKKEVAQGNTSISQEAVKKLVAYVGSDLWQMNSEINKLISYKNDKEIRPDDIDLLVKAKIDLNIFKTLDALSAKDKKTALRLLHEHLNQGENEIYLFSMFVYQLRTLIKLKDLIEKGIPFQSLAKKSGLHPYVVKKNWQQLNRFSLEQLKKIYGRLLEIELSIKKGRLDSPTALDLLIAEI